MIDIRANVAGYYDLNPEVPNDLPFYEALVPTPEATILELGCGTGRTFVPLAQRCSFAQGIDLSEAMVDICLDKLQRAGVSRTKAPVAIGDITDFNLGRTFDLIVAPFRVFQNLETDSQIRNLFRCIHAHLSSNGTCVLNVFKPRWEADKLRREWPTERETFCWEASVKGGWVTLHDRRARIDPDNLILYPELIWRRYHGDALVDEAVLRIPMRCYYPMEFSALITNHGFRIIDRLGGYAGEEYGLGPELVVHFERAA